MKMGMSASEAGDGGSEEGAEEGLETREARGRRRRRQPGRLKRKPAVGPIEVGKAGEAGGGEDREAGGAFEEVEDHGGAAGDRAERHAEEEDAEGLHGGGDEMREGDVGAEGHEGGCGDDGQAAGEGGRLRPGRRLERACMGGEGHGGEPFWGAGRLGAARGGGRGLVGVVEVAEVFVVVCPVGADVAVAGGDGGLAGGGDELAGGEGAVAVADEEAPVRALGAEGRFGRLEGLRGEAAVRRGGRADLALCSGCAAA